jgi:hypothetical protein
VHNRDIYKRAVVIPTSNVSPSPKMIKSTIKRVIDTMAPASKEKNDHKDVEKEFKYVDSDEIKQCLKELEEHNSLLVQKCTDKLKAVPDMVGEEDGQISFMPPTKKPDQVKHVKTDLKSKRKASIAVEPMYLQLASARALAEGDEDDIPLIQLRVRSKSLPNVNTNTLFEPGAMALLNELLRAECSP